MVWSYDVTQVATSTRYQVRLLIGDNLPNAQQLQDEEIDFALTQRSSIYGVGAYCARMLEAQYARRATTTVSGMSVQFADQARAYSALGDRLESLSTARGAALPYAGGISQTDKTTQESDSDRVSPEYALGMDDNYLPDGSQNKPETETGNA